MQSWKPPASWPAASYLQTIVWHHSSPTASFSDIRHNDLWFASDSEWRIAVEVRRHFHGTGVNPSNVVRKIERVAVKLMVCDLTTVSARESVGVSATVVRESRHFSCLLGAGMQQAYDALLLPADATASGIVLAVFSRAAGRLLVLDSKVVSLSELECPFPLAGARPGASL
jgi:hypothetical protein